MASVKKPASESAIKDSNLVYTAGVQGAGMRLDPITVVPTNVSFANVECLEMPGPATNIWGYFTNYPPGFLNHSPSTNWIQLNGFNAWADIADFQNHLSPWYAGGYEWDIPVRWRVVGSTNVGSLPNRLQICSIADTNGTSTVSKLGQSVTRSP